MLSKSLSTSQRFARLNVVAGRLAEFCQTLYPLLNAHADDFGRLQGDPFTVKHVCHPTSPRKVDQFAMALQALDDVGLVRWYEVDGAAYIQIIKFDEHQTGLSKRTKSRLPECPDNFSGVPRLSREVTPNRTELNGTQLNRKDQERGAPKEPAPTTRLLAAFDTLHKQRLGERAVIHGGKDAAILARLCKTHSPQLIEFLMADFFASGDEFIRKAGYTVGVFASQMGKLLARRPKAVEPMAEWFEECQRLHGGTCNGRMAHSNQVFIDEQKAAKVTA